METGALVSLLNSEADNMYKHCQALQVLLNREGRLFSVDEKHTVEDRLEELIRRAGTQQIWLVWLARVKWVERGMGEESGRGVGGGNVRRRQWRMSYDFFKYR